MRAALLSLALLLSCAVPCVALCATRVLDSYAGTCGTVRGGYEDADSVMSRMARRPLHPVEGLWEMAGEGSLLAIELIGEDPAVYVMALVRGSDLGLRRGTVAGYLTPGARQGLYDARIYSARVDEGVLLMAPRSYEARLDTHGTRLELTRYGRGLRLNWWRLLLPYMYRGAVSPMERSAEGLEGLTRVWPAPLPPLTPRYL